MRRASPSQACAILCLLAFAVVVSASNSTVDQLSSSPRERLLDDDAILDVASLRTGKSAGEILRLLTRLAESRGPPEAGHPHNSSQEPGDGGQNITSPSSFGSSGTSLERPDLDRLLRLSGFSANGGEFGPGGDHSSQVDEVEAILRFLVEVALGGPAATEAGLGSGDHPAARGSPDGKASAAKTLRRQSVSRIQVRASAFSPPLSSSSKGVMARNSMRV